MLIKSADSKEPDLRALAALLARPDVDANTRRRIQQEIRNIQAGVAGEREAAYEIEFHYAAGPDWAVIHDLRIELGDLVAQIDHLLINRGLEIWLCETKHFAERVSVDEHGEWEAFHGRSKSGIPSPIEQNRKHALVLKAALDSGMVQLPTRFGVKLKPLIRPLVLVSSRARISRPKGRAAKGVEGLESVIKVDRLNATINTTIEKGGVIDNLRIGAHLVGAETVQALGDQLAGLHRPMTIDWPARFGLPPEPAAPPAVSPSLAANAGICCASCGAPISPKVADYCRANSAWFDGQMLCWKCQPNHKRRA